MRQFLMIGSVVVLSILLSGCARVGLFVANVPASFNQSEKFQDIVYDAETQQKLDIYVPENAKEPAPVLVFLYGGRWTDGHKELYRFVADAFTKEGYVVVIPDYRKYPTVKFPAFAEDTAAAVAWVYNNADQYNIDKDRLFVAGHSSGAHLGALVATDPRYLKAYDLNRDIIKAFAGLSGPYAFVPEADDLKDMFGPPDRYPLMRASNYIDGKQPPMLLIHGLDDTIVVLENATKLQKAIEDKGGIVKLVTYDHLDHVETVGSLMWFWRYKSNTQKEMMDFFSGVEGNLRK